MADCVERRLAAILSTGVVGYSRLMAADEAGTLARLNLKSRFRGSAASGSARARPMPFVRLSGSLNELLAHSPVRVVFGSGRLAELGETAKAEGAKHVLLVTDPGIVRAGHADRAVQSLKTSGIRVTLFDGAAENPTTEHVASGVKVAREASIDFIVGLGGGSAMDCAKGVNLILTNGGAVADYWGINKPTEPMLPMISVPTTAGTGTGSRGECWRICRLRFRETQFENSGAIWKRIARGRVGL